MQGTDMRAIEAVRNATTRRLTAAGGITTMDEVAFLDSIGVDAVVGMAIYTGRMSLPPQPNRGDPDKRATDNTDNMGKNIDRAPEPDTPPATNLDSSADAATDLQARPASRFNRGGDLDGMCPAAGAFLRHKRPRAHRDAGRARSAAGRSAHRPTPKPGTTSPISCGSSASRCGYRRPMPAAPRSG